MRAVITNYDFSENKILSTVHELEGGSAWIENERVPLSEFADDPTAAIRMVPDDPAAIKEAIEDAEDELWCRLAGYGIL